mmetsp:Transcript_63417/g.71007  ORF Transcript_63417/g.71007 Transcript_63417/m.71007 type:complete len:247 (+) Transcript_63417:297-1037(+)
MASITSKLQDVSLSARQSIQDAKDATTATLSSPRLSLDGSTGSSSGSGSGRKKLLFTSSRNLHSTDDSDDTVAAAASTEKSQTMKLAIDRINVRWKIFSAGVKMNVDDSMEEVKTDMKLLKQDSTRLFRVASERASASMRGMGEMGDSMMDKVMKNSNHTKNTNRDDDATTGGGRGGGGGAMGGNVPNLQHAAILYRTQLQSLREMGLLVVAQNNNNEQFCLELLQQQGGDLEQTVAVLLIKKVTK